MDFYCPKYAIRSNRHSSTTLDFDNSTKGSHLTNVPIGNGGRIWEMLKNLESTPWKQLGEFIDNSISSSMSGDDPDRPVQIDINFDPDYGHGEKMGGDNRS